MKKHFLLLLLLPFIISAQQPFGKNATWYFDYTESITNGYTKVTYASDTIMKNATWQKFKVTGLEEQKFGSGPNDIVQDTQVVYPDVFTTTRNDSVFYLNTQGDVQLLFDFNAQIGDQWVFAYSVSQYGCNNVPKATVMAIGFDTINGQALKYWEIENPMDTFIILNQKVYMCASGYCMPTKIYKDIGCNWYSFIFAPSPNACNNQPLNLPNYQIRCYSSPSLSVNFTNKACNYWSLIGVDENELAQFNVYPNPTTGMVQIDATKKIASVSVFDVTGRLLAVHEKTTSIKLPSKNGLYFLSILFEDGSVATEKVNVRN